MKMRELLREENEAIFERYTLSVERIGEFLAEESVAEPYRGYFYAMAEFVKMIDEVVGFAASDDIMRADYAELKTLNGRLYADIKGSAYETSYANPAYAARMLAGEASDEEAMAIAGMLCWLYTELRGGIAYAFEERLTDITVANELLIEVYNLFEEGTPKAASLKETIYWWNSDYSDIFMPWRIREQVDPQLTFASDIIMNEDLSDPRYLYLFGEYVSENEEKTAAYLASLPEDEIEKIASTYTEGYRIGFEVAGKPLYKKKTVDIRYQLGFERIVRAAIGQFAAMGLKPVIYREALHSQLRKPQGSPGYCSTAPNRQYAYDHKNDYALYFDKRFMERKLGVLRSAYETYKEDAAGYAGPAVIEVFGEENFAPVNCKEALVPTEKQQGYQVSYNSQAGQIINTYIHGDERSFTIIAFPIPEIGPDFEEIFSETVRINTLDYHLYQDIQQKLIDAMDQGVCAHVKGSGMNRTDLTIALHPIHDPATETIFENCVADVNIPVGEVFTSPILTGTNGTLHVSQVYLNGLRFEDLEIRIENGMTKTYSCGNFAAEEENQAYIREHILFEHPSLPMGEFAIGTNTTAYSVGRKYNISDKLPILIAEKTGPHFAFGDTCYSWEEDGITRNPDGKNIVAKDNECSILRKEDPEKAYFNCHTDITIPYDELGSIVIERADGSMIPIIEDGRFVLPGTEVLNEAFD